ncbi:BTB/POZ domain containing protein [Nitzschia inconspicua]|uniref:BTB/POZ domain containing protein n=1 Tax=Nitzschia inconspicua TaxID=303405 RepID=A0A9K3KR04_9STRA|nr:BTB/POZ domain containing protein [Nitzschia inconspicua]
MDRQDKADDDTRFMGSSIDCSVSNTQSADDYDLSWRSDPLYNFSDWTIRVEGKAENICSNDSIETYHVHRNILAIGPRRSGYFANLFHYGIDDGDRCTHVELNERVASFFPDFLDYMYASKAFTIATRNSIALLFLSESFQVTSLHQQVERFIESDINLVNFGWYMTEALYYSDEAMAMKVMDKCGNEVLQFCGNNQNLSRLLRTPLSSTTSKAREKVQDAWTFLTGASTALVAPAIAGVRRRPFPWATCNGEHDEIS